MNKVKFFPYFLITIGVLLILKSLKIIESVWNFWPIYLILLGLILIINSVIEK